MPRLLSSQLLCIYLILFSLIGVCFPMFVQAATITARQNGIDIAAEDNALIEVRLNTEGQTFNAIEGLVSLHLDSGPIYIRDINLGGSELSLWPNRPSVTVQESGDASIDFVGGVPGGFIGQDVLLFTVVVTATQPGTLFINPVSIVAFAHDGQGTPVAVRSEEAKIRVKEARSTAEDHWQVIIEKDTNPPLPFTVFLGQDPSVFDGQKFISFYTTDAESGIDRYEVQEGDLGTVRSSSPYILRDQLNSLPVTVYAFDKAGNVQTAYLDRSSLNLFQPVRTILILFICIVVGFCVIIIWQWRRFQHKKFR